ncbi:MAG: lysozyme [Frankiales bacterium]|nr:lysozyme [Frankiales bacterium]
MLLPTPHLRRSLLAVSVLSLVAALLPAVAARAAAPVYLSGPDVSHWQHAAGPVTWSQIKGAGKQSFAISKATEDTNFTDPWFAADYAAEKANGLIRGGYHFARPKLPMSTAIAQADYYASVIGNVKEAGDLPPIMDFEESGGLSSRDLITWTQTFLAELMTRTGRVPMIYTYRNFWRTAMLNTTAFIRYPLWIADWTSGATVPTPPLIGGWPTWAMWQWTSTAKIAGVTGIVDDSHFNGNAAQLAAFADGTHPSVLSARPPQAPVAVQAGPAGNALSVSWVPADNGGRALTSYTVTVSPGGKTVTVPGTQTSVVIPGLTSSQLYAASVVAISPAGRSPASAPSTPVGATKGVVPVMMTLGASSATAVSGRSKTLTGVLQRTDGLGGVGGAPLVVYAKQTGAAGYTAVTSVITSATGSFAVPVTSSTTTRYSIRYAGGAGWGPVSAGILVYAKASVTTALSKLSVPRNTHVTLRGQVSYAAVGRTVFRQRWYANAWHTGPGAKVSASGRYSFTVVPTVKGKTKLRVILGSKAGLVGSVSPTVVLNVR